MPESDDPVPTRIGDYLIEGLLGAGGMAKVYRAKHAILDTQHAIKVLDPEYRANAEARSRFLDEAKIQAKHLDHPNIVKVTNIVATAEHAALVMELIEGKSLEDKIAELKAQPAEIKRIMLAVLDGVGYAHKAGIIHRDLKPANVLLAKRDGQDVPKVTDFGIAKLIQPDDGKGSKKSTHAAARMGTLAYMAPEQIRRAKDVTARSDIFSLGAMLYEMATGEMAFGGDSEYDVMENIVNGRYQLPERRFDKIDPLLASVIQKALATDPADRFASCDEMAKALRGEIKVEKKAAAAAAVPAPAPVPKAEPKTEPTPEPAPAPKKSDAPAVTPAPAPADRGGSKKTLVLVLVVAALALGGGAIYLATRGDKTGGGSGGGGSSGSGGSAIATNEADAHANDEPVDAEAAPATADATAVAVETPSDAALGTIGHGAGTGTGHPVDAGMPAVAVTKVRADAGVARVPPKPDAAVAVATAPTNSCGGRWNSAELVLNVTGSATTCGGSYTLIEGGTLGRGKCAGSLGSCRIIDGKTIASFACKYDAPIGIADQRGDRDAGTFTMICGTGGTSAIVSIDRLAGETKNIAVKR